MYDYALRKSVEAIFFKLAKKRPKQLEIILSKIEEIIVEPHRYKCLTGPLKHMRRVHIDKSFVLVFSIDEAEKTVIIEDYDHHDKIYIKR